MTVVVGVLTGLGSPLLRHAQIQGRQSCPTTRWRYVLAGAMVAPAAADTAQLGIIGVIGVILAAGNAGDYRPPRCGGVCGTCRR